METPKLLHLTESPMWTDPKKALGEALQILELEEGDPLKDQIRSYLKSVAESESPKDDSHQNAMKVILDVLVERGEREKAGALFNIHRVLTEFAGYSANEQASSDVDECFSEKFEVPKDGAIIVDFFIARNLPRIIEICEQRGIDLKRIRVHVPKSILAAQLIKLTSEKKEAFRKACEKLSENQFRIEDVLHNGDIASDESVAIWFSPRTLAIYPRLHGESEAQMVQNFSNEYAKRAKQLVPGGRMFANLAFSDEWTPFNAEFTEGKRHLIKLTGVSKNAAKEVITSLELLGMRYIGKGDFDPNSVNSKIDHQKTANELHFMRLA